MTSADVQRGRWKRRVAWTVGVLVAARIVLAVAWPRVLHAAAARVELDVEWTQGSLSVLGGSFEIENLVARPKLETGALGEPLARIERVVVDLAMLDLCRGHPRVRLAAIEGLQVDLERPDGGHWNFERAWSALNAPSGDGRVPSRPAEAADEPFDLSLPVEIDAFRARDVTLLVRDAAARPPVATRVDFSLALTHFGSPEVDAELLVQVTSPNLLDAARIDGKIRRSSAVESAGGISFSMAGLRPKALTGWLRPLGVEPRAERITLDARGRFSASTVGEERHGMRARAALSHVVLRVDESEHAGLDRLEVEMPTIEARRVADARIDLAGVRARVERLANGNWMAFGLEIDAARRSVSPAEHGPAEAELAKVAWGIESARAESIALRFVDGAVTPPSTLTLEVERATLADFGTEPGLAGRPARVDVAARAPGIADSLTVSGTLDVLRARRDATLRLTAGGIAPRALAGHLRELGLESTLEKGEFGVSIVVQGQTNPDGSTSGELHVHDLAVDDGGQLFGIRGIDVTGARLDPARRAFHVDGVQVEGLRLPVRREASGALSALGLRTTERAPPRATDGASPNRPPRTGSEPPPARIECDRFALVSSVLDWHDESHAPAVEAAFDDWSIEASGLAFGGDPALHAPSTARVRFRSTAHELVREFDVSGTITTKPGTLDVAAAFDLAASGITLRKLQPYLDPAGVEQHLVGASARARLAATIRDEDGALAIDAAATDLQLTDEDHGVASVRSIRVDGLRAAAGRVSARAIAVDEPRVLVRRDPLGGLLALGLRLPATAFESGVEPSVDSPVASHSRAEELLSGLPSLDVGSLRVAGAELAWNDEGRSPPLNASARLDVALDRFTTRDATRPARLSIHVSSPGAAESVDVEGTIALDARTADIQARIAARGLNATTLGPYLPSGLACDLVDGRFEARAWLTATCVAEGGVKLSTGVADLELREGDAQDALLRLGALSLNANRLDPVAGVIDVDDVSADGVDVDVRRSPDGAVHALGFVFGSASPRAPVRAPSTVADAPRPRPLQARSIRVRNLDLALDSLRWRDESGDVPARPLHVSASLGNALPIDLLAEPVELVVQGSAGEIVGSFRANLGLRVLDDEPSFHLALSARGIRGEGLTDLVPSLVGRIDGRGLTEGALDATLDGRLRWKRRGPLDFEPRGGLGAEIKLERVAFFDRPAGTLLAGVDGIDVDVRKFDPESGDLHVASVDVRNPRIRVTRESAGVRALGVVFRPTRDAGLATKEANAEVPPTPSTGPVATPEVRVDSFTVHGIDAEIRDESATPPTFVPLNDLDVEVTRFTTRLFTRPGQMRFSAHLGAGEIDLPVRARASGLLTGTLGAIGSAISGGGDAFALGRQKVFDEIALTGRVGFFPALEGHAQLDLTALELLGVRGSLAGAGLDVGDGKLDSSVRLRFKGTDGVTVDSQIVFTDLSLSEPKGGLVETYLRLPVPLDTALFLLKNDAGEHRIPVGFRLGEDGLSGGQVASAAVTATASVLANALASAPLRIVGTFTDLLGLTGRSESGADEPALVSFDTASTAPRDVERELAPILERLRDDAKTAVVVQHQLGRRDVERAAKLANPSAAECVDLVGRLRQRKAELLRARTEVAARARADHAVGRGDEARSASSELSRLDRELGQVESSIDFACELLRPGAERSRDKRTRILATAIARARLDAIHDALARSGVADIESRIELRSPTMDVSADDSPGRIVLAVKKRG